MKIKPFTLKSLVILFFIAFVSSCTVDEYEFVEDTVEMEMEMDSDTILIEKRERVHDKDGD